MVQQRFFKFCLLALLGVASASRRQSAAELAQDLKRVSSHIQSTLPKSLTAEERMHERKNLRFVADLIKMKGVSYTDTFCSRSLDNCTTVDGYPGGNCHSELTFEKVVEELPKTPGREASGEIRRLGDLGYFIFNALLWEKDWMTFPIGADIEDHRKHRPTADLLMGRNSRAWNRDMIRESVKEFFHGRTSMATADIGVWVNKLLHKLMLDMDLTDIEAQDFENYKGASMTLSILPTWLVKGFKRTLSLRATQKARDLWLEKYEAAMEKDQRGIIPHLEGRDRRFLADLLLTTLTSAGGLSLPTVIQICVAVLYSGKNSPLPEAERKLTEKNIEPLVLETIRRYPGVVGFPWWSPDQSKRTLMALALALRDPRAWEDAETFKLRPLSEYHKQAGTATKIGVAWAAQAVGYNGLTPDSRGCPAQAMSVVVVTEFLRGLLPMQSEWVVTEMPEGGIVITEGPSAASAFTLTRGVDGSTPPKMVNGALPLWQRDATFECPSECKACCQATLKWSILLHRQDKERFQCIMPKADMAAFKITGRACKGPEISRSDPTQGSAICKFTGTEQALNFHEDLLPCSWDPAASSLSDQE